MSLSKPLELAPVGMLPQKKKPMHIDEIMNAIELRIGEFETDELARVLELASEELRKKNEEKDRLVRIAIHTAGRCSLEADSLYKLARKICPDLSPMMHESWVAQFGFLLHMNVGGLRRLLRDPHMARMPEKGMS